MIIIKDLTNKIKKINILKLILKILKVNLYIFNDFRA